MKRACRGSPLAVGLVDVHLELVNGPAAARQARTALHPIVEHVSDEQFSDLRVIVSELVANATSFGPGDEISVSVSLDEDHVIRGRVNDNGDPGAIQVSEGDAVEARGLGLLIVDSLAASWGIDHERGGVWFEVGTPALNGNGAAPTAATPPTPQVQEQIGSELMDLHQRLYGKGAQSAQVLLSEDAVVVFLDGLELQPSEDIEAPFSAAVERVIGRKVVSFASITKLQPNYVCEVFRLAPV